MIPGEDSRTLWPYYLACYAFLIVVAALGVVLMQGTMMVLVRIGVLLGATRYVMTVINQFGFIILGILWLIGVFSVEAYLRHGVQINRLWTRMGKVLVWEVGLLLLVFVVQSISL